MTTVAGIVVPTGSPAVGRRTFLDVKTELARPINAGDPTTLALAGDAFQAAVRWYDGKGNWPWEWQDEEINITTNERFSTVQSRVKKELSMHYILTAGAAEDERIEFQRYNVFKEKYSTTLTGKPEVYTIPNFFETAKIRWFPTPSADYLARFTFYRHTPVPQRDADVLEIPDMVTGYYMARAWYEFMKRLPSAQRVVGISEARADANAQFSTITAHVETDGDMSSHHSPTGGPS